MHDKNVGVVPTFSGRSSRGKNNTWTKRVNANWWFALNNCQKWREILKSFFSILPIKQISIVILSSVCKAGDFFAPFDWDKWRNTFWFMIGLVFTRLHIIHSTWIRFEFKFKSEIRMESIETEGVLVKGMKSIS